MPMRVWYSTYYLIASYSFKCVYNYLLIKFYIITNDSFWKLEMFHNIFGVWFSKMGFMPCIICIKTMYCGWSTINFTNWFECSIVNLFRLHDIFLNNLQWINLINAYRNKFIHSFSIITTSSFSINNIPRPFMFLNRFTGLLNLLFSKELFCL